MPLAGWSSMCKISIHALREEGDRSPRTSWHWTKQFLSTPSVRRATAETDQWDYMPALFLSTPSARRATKLFCKDGEVSAISIHALREEGDRAKMELSRNQNNFYPRPPRGGRLTGGTTMAGIFKISIHALREEGDCKDALDKLEKHLFLSTPSARRATARGYNICGIFKFLKPPPPVGGRRTIPVFSPGA